MPCRQGWCRYVAAATPTVWRRQSPARYVTLRPTSSRSSERSLAASRTFLGQECSPLMTVPGCCTAHTHMHTTLQPSCVLFLFHRHSSLNWLQVCWIFKKNMTAGILGDINLMWPFLQPRQHCVKALNCHTKYDETTTILLWTHPITYRRIQPHFTLTHNMD